MEEQHQGSVIEEQFILLELAGEMFGIETALVSTIVKPLPTTWVPGAPDYVDGVINLRDEVIAIVDLRRRFGLPHQEPTRSTRFAIIRVGDENVGVVIDAVSNVLNVPQSEIHVTPHLAVTIDKAYIKGVISHEGLMVILLNISRVLTNF